MADINLIPNTLFRSWCLKQLIHSLDSDVLRMLQLYLYEISKIHVFTAPSVNELICGLYADNKCYKFIDTNGIVFSSSGCINNKHGSVIDFIGLESIKSSLLKFYTINAYRADNYASSIRFLYKITTKNIIEFGIYTELNLSNGFIITDSGDVSYYAFKS